MALIPGAKVLQTFFKNIDKAARNWEESLVDHVRRVSGPLAARMLVQMGLDTKTTAPFGLFDNACGAGAVAAALDGLVQPEVLRLSHVLCGDFSEPVIGLVKKRITSEGWVNTEAKVVDAQTNGLASGNFTHVTTNIGFHVVPDSKAALDETLRVLKPGGVLGFTTWHKTPGWASEVEAAFKAFPFPAPMLTPPLQTTTWGDWGDVNWVRQTLVDRGLEEVQVEVFEYQSRVDSADHFVTSTSMMIDWVTNSSWSEELRKEHGKEEVYGLIKDFLEKRYDGKPWDISWSALVATGRVPSD
ncbi:S-adenosyl-L-methionine-dependent methyltransferase [Podospora didyma]|uniref:S-adenosyl-L-methionine-dependent methyltransferase n=1 Tax=Podospora didyma TaxID=330526 RepID=A0AAE0U3U7_9PEZI|nr:S-adenosyl-L-methionine-dependent methyltransferase [Podospora didyma]